MKKLKIYLDTSVISYLFAEDTPEKMNQTLEFWEYITDDKFDIYISSTTIDEIKDCSEPKRSMLQEKINNIKYKKLIRTHEVILLAIEYIKNDILTENNFDDCMHIAYAVINKCDYIASWNFKHLVKMKTENKVKIVNAVNNYKKIKITTPEIIMRSVKSND